MSNLKTILITGAAGFIGSHLADYYLAQGHQVIGIDNINDYYSANIKASNLEQLISHKNGKFYELDLLNYGSLESIFETHQIHYIVHLAAMAGVRPSVNNPLLYQKNNNESTQNLLELACKFNFPKFIFASSSSVYGAKNPVPFKEDADISKPISPYAATKVAGEAMIHSICSVTELKAVCLRFFTVYGPRQRPDLAIHKFTNLIYNNQKIDVYGDGTFQRDFTYIEDIIQGIDRALNYDTKFEIFNLGESETTSVNELIRLIEEALNKKADINYLDVIKGDVPITFADISKARKLTSYNPQTKIQDGIQKFVKWYLSQESSKTLLS
jgi:UDP-glucuronate 4-epimerase